MLIPSILYGLSLLFTLPASVMTAPPMMFACFIFIEGLYGVFTFM